MTAIILINGKLFRDPEAKASGKGNAYAMATVRDGQGDDAAWFRVFAFNEQRDELLTHLGTLRVRADALPPHRPEMRVFCKVLVWSSDDWTASFSHFGMSDRDVVASALTMVLARANLANREAVITVTRNGEQVGMPMTVGDILRQER